MRGINKGESQVPGGPHVGLSLVVMATGNVWARDRVVGVLVV